MGGIPELFASRVFNDQTMRQRLPKETYQALRKTVQDGRSLDRSVANVVASAMKEWAIEQGATHFTHWFQPMTGTTAEKHDSFVSPSGDGGIIMEFSGKELIRGESDASSFPSGGLRATFEARGYTAWDPTSYAFLKDGTLCIPTAFCSYTGEALDKKTPLMRSADALNRQGRRLLKLFGHPDGTRILTTVGPEQEYFLVDEAMFQQRPDLVYTGRTLFGARPPKGQDLDDHYFGSLRPRVSAFMKELDEELWRVGIYAKTKHNEVAPAQHELATVFTTGNIAADHNQLTMEIMKTVANRHNMVCLLHEKPFADINGSGKHDNWSMVTSTGVNLLEPGDSPWENAQFLLFLCAVIKAVDDHQDLLRLSVASAGNDHRLGAGEAPPAIISIFVGDDLAGILDAIEQKEAYDPQAHDDLSIGVHVLPKIPRDTTDRNRTSPFAFTGNKFEFRMLGSSGSVADPNTMLNTAVAESLRQYADELEAAQDFTTALNKLIRRTVRKHKRVIFNGNNYTREWEDEAQRRGLLNLRSTADALPWLTAQKNTELFQAHRVFTAAEVHSRQEILLENYCKILHIEALTMLEMAQKDILPAALAYQGDIAEVLMAKRETGLDLPCRAEEALLKQAAKLSEALHDGIEALQSAVNAATACCDAVSCATAHREGVFAAMEDLRAVGDALERLLGTEHWPYPTYGDLLFSV